MNEDLPPLRLKPRIRPESPAPLSTPTDPAPNAAAAAVLPLLDNPVTDSDQAKLHPCLQQPAPSEEPQPLFEETLVEPAGESPAPARPLPPEVAPGLPPAHPAVAEAEGIVPLDPVSAPAPDQPEKKPASRVGVFLLLLLAVLVMGGGGILAVRLIKGSKTKPLTPPATQTVTASPAPPLQVATPPPALVDSPVSPMGKALARAQETTARATEQSRLTEILPSTKEPTRSPAGSGTVTEPPLPPAFPKSPQPSHGQVVAESNAAPAFIAFVEAARISGVFQGNPPRALINGRTVRTGGIVDPALGVTFDQLDADGHWVIFRDATGAMVKKGY